MARVCAAAEADVGDAPQAARASGACRAYTGVGIAERVSAPRGSGGATRVVCTYNGPTGCRAAVNHKREIRLRKTWKSDEPVRATPARGNGRVAIDSNNNRRTEGVPYARYSATPPRSMQGNLTTHASERGS